MRHLSILLLCLLATGLSAARANDRWVPEHCFDLAVPGVGWNQAYRDGIAAIENGALDIAEQEMCGAAFAARSFGPRDWRFAETLDELGLIAFTLRDFELAERVQGAAIAEMLLAVGPHGEPFHEKKPSDESPIRPDCSSGVRVYTTRLGWIHERVPARISTAEIGRAPWRVFVAGYLPLDSGLAKRLEWLISEYLLEENLVAADELTQLQRQITGDTR
jgi:hypothetical protein